MQTYGLSVRFTDMPVPHVEVPRVSDGYDLSTNEAAGYLHVHPDTLRRWVKNGNCGHFKTPGGWYRFRLSDLDALTDTEAAS